jgi:hypothetical protein
MRHLPNGCTEPTDATLDHDGRCIRSDLPPGMCGLACHRNAEQVPVVEAIFDTGRAAA